MARAISITNAEISMIFYTIGFIMTVVCMKIIWNLYVQVQLIEFVMMLFIMSVALLFFFIAAAWMCYLVTKHNLNMFLDRITNPDFIGWLRFTRGKMLRPQIVKRGPLGQQKGIANGEKADIINDGDYTITLSNGNRAVIKSDWLSTNINLDKVKGWQLIKKHHGMIGYDAYAKAAEEDHLLFDVEEEPLEEEEEKDGEVQSE